MWRFIALFFLLFPNLSPAQNFNLTLESTVNFPGQSLANVWGYSAGGQHYALVGAQNGMVVINITSPSSPVPVDTIPGPSNLWKEIKTYGNYAYVVSEGGSGIQVVNLSTLPAGNLAYQSVFPNIPGVGTVNSAHALQVDESAGFLYIYGAKITGGTLIGYPLCFNLNGSTSGVPNAWSPQYVGRFIAPGFNTYVHDGYANGNMLYGSHIYAGKFAIVNMTNKAAPVLLGSQNTPNNFTHNTWLEGTTLFTTDETNNSYLASYDVSDPTDIKELDRLQVTPGSGSIVHNTYTKNGYAITSWYKDGVVIADVSRPGNMVVTGRYDTYPAGGGGGFEGCWGVYPYFTNSDIIIASNLGTNTNPYNGQLYILTPTYTRGCHLEGVVRDASNNAPLSGATVQLLSSGVANETSAPQTGIYKMARYGGGSYTLQVSKTGYVTANIPVTLSTGTLTTQNVALQPLAVPVALSVFEARLQDDNTAALKWETETEKNNRGFHIEQSANGIEWTRIGFVAGKGQSNTAETYQFRTNVLGSGQWLFRLAQEDTDGAINYSDIESVQVQEKRFSVRMTPNPVLTEAAVQVEWGNVKGETLNVEVFNGNVQLVQQLSGIERNGDQQLVPLQVSELPTGKYLVRVTVGNSISSLQMIKI